MKKFTAHSNSHNTHNYSEGHFDSLRFYLNKTVSFFGKIILVPSFGKAICDSFIFRKFGLSRSNWSAKIWGWAANVWKLQLFVILKKKFLINFIIFFLLPEEQPAQRLQVPAQEPLQEPQLGLANTTEITKRRETQI